MPAVVIPIGERTRTLRSGTRSLLEVCPPGASPAPLGILLVDGETGDARQRLRPSAEFPDLEEQEIDILDFLPAELDQRAREMGGQALIASLEDSLSDFFRISGRTAITWSGDPRRTLDRLFDEHVNSEVRPYVTHLPLFGLRAAATKFGEGMDSEQEGWVRVPGHLRLTEQMFVARVVGRSMEPLIPDGSLCVFRTGVTGSRQGKRLLIEKFGETDFVSRYTVKRYTSRKIQNEPGTRERDEADGDEGWSHESIRLEPLNREFEAFELGPDEFRVVAEFVEVLGF